MLWEDLFIMIATILLSYALVPQVIYGFKKKKKFVVIQTSLLTTIGLLMLTISYISLELPLALISNSVAVILWMLILIQGSIYKE
ncbi:MAG: hypothetical protein NUV97_02150 [archaeon]|nr:hypothetical protein [archaeon]MCR4323752.1 hypothetical protein [Nanoarchaeota archaeon]